MHEERRSNTTMKNYPGFTALRFATILAGSAALLPRGAFALSWDCLAQAQTVAKGTPAAETVFHYVNHGLSEVLISSVETSCKCTTAEPSKSRLGPGESGELNVRMDVAARSGTVEKTITVTSSDAPATPTVLSFSVTIHAALDASPRLLSWTVGEAPARKSAAVTADLPSGTAVPSISVPSGLRAWLVAAGAPGQFDLRVEPERTDKPLVGEIVISLQPSKGPKEQILVYAQVR